MSIPRSLESWCLVLALLSAFKALAADDIMARRARIEHERVAVQATARDAEAACARRFAVSSCVQAVHDDRRSKLHELDRQRALLDDGVRKQRAAERTQRLRERQEAAARESEQSSPEVKARAPRAPETKTSATRDQEATRASRVETDQAEAGRRAHAHTARERGAATHREVVERKNRERAAKKPPVAGLPVPAQGASAAAR